MRIALVAVSLLLSAVALAQPSRPLSPYAPEPEDYDRADEDYSAFWSSATDEGDLHYRRAVERGIAFLKNGDEASRRAAIDELRAATRMLPRIADGHYWLGRAYAADMKWAECAASLGETFRLDPGYRPADETVEPGRARAPASLEDGKPWQLHYELARCQSQSGDYEGAADHLRRILAAGNTDIADVHLRLGEMYMALGRLVEAQGTLETAVELSGGPEARYALAVAYDRDEQIDLARRTIERAIRLDRRMSALLRIDRLYTPPEDVHYYLGMAHEASGQHALALYHFRVYSRRDSGPFGHRALAHVTALEDYQVGSDLEVTGTAAIDTEPFSRSIARVAPALLRCVESDPTLLLEVTVNSLARGGDSHVKPGVRVVVLGGGDTPDERQHAAVDCAEAAARRLATPTATGRPGTYATAKFTVIAR